MQRGRSSFLHAVALANALILTLLPTLVGCGGGATSTGGGRQSGTVVSGATTGATSGATSAAATTNTGVRTPTKTSATGHPFVGGSYADFVQQYGKPFTIGASGRALFHASSAPLVVLGVSPTSGVVRYAGGDGPGNWTTKQAADFCAQFLPKGATAYHSDQQHTYYHSGVGDLHLDAPSAGAGTSGTGTGTCSLVLTNTP
jgi:hypothetical protein